METGYNNKIKKNFVENELVEVWIENGIIIEIFKPNVIHVDIASAKKIVELRLSVSKGVMMPMFVDSVNVKKMDSESRKYLSEGDGVKYVSACAFHVHDYVAWVVGKIFLTFFSPTSAIKTQIFRSRAKAIEWLQHYKNLN